MAMSTMRAFRKPSRSNTSLAALTNLALVCSPLRERGALAATGSWSARALGNVRVLSSGGWPVAHSRPPGTPPIMPLGAHGFGIVGAGGPATPVGVLLSSSGSSGLISTSIFGSG